MEAAAQSVATLLLLAFALAAGGSGSLLELLGLLLLLLLEGNVLLRTPNMKPKTQRAQAEK